MKKAYLSSETTGAPLSGAIEANGLVFVSGQIHADKELNLIGNTIEEKFKIAIANVEHILNNTGLSLENIVNIKLYLTDLNELSALNKEYNKYFSHPMPSRTAIGVAALPLGASLEVEVVAIK